MANALPHIWGETEEGYQARLKARANSEAQQQAAHKERVGRIEEVADYLSTKFITEVRDDAAIITHGGQKFQVREIDEG